MRRLWLVIKREYLTRVKSKGFIISTIGLPLFSIGIFGFSIFLATRQADHSVRIGVVDEVGGLAATLSTKNLDKLKNGDPPFQIVETAEPPHAAGARERFIQEIRGGKLDSYLYLPKDILDSGSAEFHSKNAGDITITGQIGRVVSDAVIARRLSDRGLKLADPGKIIHGVDIKMVNITQSGETEEHGQTFIMAIAVGMLLYISLLVYGITTMRSVMEEKNTRVIELLISSVKSFHLLLGKIIGVGAVGFTQYLIWTVCGALVSTYGLAMAHAFNPNASLPTLHLHLASLVYLVIFFLGGYFLYASLYAAVGAMVSNDQEGQQLATPLTLMIVVSFLMFQMVIKDPNSKVSVIVSLIPFFAPILMLMRISVQTPPLWQILLSIGILLGTTLLLIKLSAKIYRTGILMYGKRPSLLEVLKWLRYS